MKRVIAVMISVLLLLALTFQAAGLSTVAVKGIKLNSSKVSLNVGQTYQLKTTLTPANTTQKTLTYNTANKNIATVDTAGKIKAVGKGTTTITVYTANKSITAKCTVTVSAIKPVTLTILESVLPDVPFAETEVGKEIQKRLSITVEDVIAQDDKIKIMIAASDLPDIPMLNTTHQQETVTNGQALPLDDLLKTNGPDILKNFPKQLNYMRQFLSNGTGKVYYLPTNAGLDVPGVDFSIGWFMRWDYYKELNYPAMKNEDDLLNVLKQMVDKHPKTDDGKKVYGVGAWNDWQLWSYTMPMAIVYGYSNLNTYGQVVTTDTNEIINNYTDPNSPLWKTVTFYYKANKLGILDPDFATMKYDDFAAKMTAGQELFTPASWPAGDTNGKLAKDGKGFEAIPLDWGHQWFGASQLGFLDKCLGISKNCKNPDRAMDLLNFLWSYDGAALAWRGVKGSTWDVVNGVPQIKPEVIANRTANNQAWKQTGMENTSCGIMCGFGENYINPNDNTSMSLFNAPSAFASLMTPLTTDFAKHYGVKYPYEAFAQRVADGKNINQKKFESSIGNALPTAPDDIKAIDAKCDDIITKAVNKAIMSGSDADFDAAKAKAIADVKAAGNANSFAWWQKSFNDVKAKILMK